MFKLLKIAFLVLSLGLFGDFESVFAAPPEVETLIKKLSDQNAVIRLNAAKELAKLKEKAKDAIAKLKTVSANDPDEDVRNVAKNAVIAIEASSPFATAATAVETYIKQLSDNDVLVRLKAAKELGKLKEKAKEAISKLKMVAASDPDEDVRNVAKNALALIETSTHDEQLAPIIKNLRAKDVKTRLAAIATLEKMGVAAKPAGAALVEFGIMTNNQTIVDAANAALEKIDPIVHKEIITVFYDRDINKKNNAVNKLKSMESDAKAAVPIIKGYHSYLVSNNHYAPRHTLDALVKISPADEGVHSLILGIVGAPISKLETPLEANAFLSGFRPSDDDYLHSREYIIKLMNDLPIDENKKLKALVSGIAIENNSENQPFSKSIALMILEIRKVRVDNKDKLAVLTSLFPKLFIYRAFVIDEIGNLGADAKAALPMLQKLKTDSDEEVRTAANNAINKINK